MDAAKPEPMPIKGKTNILNAVIKDLIDRSEIGKKKYGTVLESNNGRDALMDAYQEALDLCMYLRQVIEERNTPLYAICKDIKLDMDSLLPGAIVKVKKDQAHHAPDPLSGVNQKGFKPGCY